MSLEGLNKELLDRAIDRILERFQIDDDLILARERLKLIWINEPNKTVIKEMVGALCE